MPTQTVNTYPNLIPLEARRPDLAVLVAVTIASGFVVAQGDVLGKITSSGFYRRKSRTTVTGTAVSTTAVTFGVVDASVFAVGDVLTDSSGNSVGTVLSLNTAASPNTVTLAADAGHNVAIGADVIATDGSAVAQGISNQGADGSANLTINVYIAGLLLAASLIGLSGSTNAELGGVTVADGIFKF
jgi:hypothetical protein